MTSLSTTAASLAAAVLAGVLGCAQPPAQRESATPSDQPATSEWHRQPVLEKAVSRNIVLYNHADKSLRSDTIVELLQTQYDFLRKYTGGGPSWILVHVGNGYPNGFAIGAAPHPEMFLQAERIFDTQHDFAHEMMHCFTFTFGRLPHWFNESLSDVAYVDSEIELYRRRTEAPFLESFDRIDHRSYELLSLRRRYGREYFPRVLTEMRNRLEECRQALGEDSDLEERNLFLVRILSAAANADLLPLFVDEFGFNPRTRERQRGY